MMFIFNLSSVQEWHDMFYKIAKEQEISNPSASIHFFILRNVVQDIRCTLTSAINSSFECAAAVEYFQERIKELESRPIEGSSLETSISKDTRDMKINLYQLSHDFLVNTYPTLTSTSLKLDHLYGFRLRIHYAIETLQKRYPTKNPADYWVNEYELRHLVNGRICPQYPPNLTEGWPERVIPYDNLNSWPIRNCNVFIPAIVEVYRNDLVEHDNEYPPPTFSLNVWWSAEDAHFRDPVGTWVLVWREWDSDQIHEGWIQRIAPYINDSKLTWQHWQTRYPANTNSPLPLIVSFEK
uniref:Uncharacterized protein n=1 Tax=viral metagenome TaxID=1070528 RepID=A0A6C0KTS0_9ZZZZ